MTAQAEMKAIRIHQFGGSEVLRYESAPIPQAADDEILIKVAATAYNPVDLAMRSGYLQKIFSHEFPYIPNIEVSGTVEASGAAVSGFKPGDNVYAFLDMSKDGAAAEYVTTKAEFASLAPKTISLADAAALPVGALTAWQGLFEHGRLAAGQRVLIAGAAGGVGAYAVQLAKLQGAYVIGTASARSSVKLRDLGIDEIIDYQQEEVTGRVNEKLDLILNLSPESTETISTWLPLLKEGGILVSTANPADAELAKRYGIHVVQMGARQDGGQLSQIASLVESGKLEPWITERLALQDLVLVHEQSAAGKIHGKVLITVE